MKVKVGLSGLPGSGKTTTLLKIIPMLIEEGLTVGGVITEEIKEEGKRVGFYMKDVVSGEKAVMAHINFRTRVRVGKYYVDTKVVDDLGVRALKYALEHCDVVVIDEIGKMEMGSKKFIDAVREVLESDKWVVLTMHRKARTPLLQEIRRRDDVRILEVTPINRNLLPFRVLEIIKKEM